MKAIAQTVLFIYLLGSCLAQLQLSKLSMMWPNSPVLLSASDANCPAHPDPVPLPSPLPDVIQEALVELEALLEATINKISIPGISASVIYRDSVIWSKGFGVKEKTKPDIPDGKTIFRIGSVSKVFATLVLYQMYEQGWVKSLDDSLAEYCVDFSIQNPFGSSGITLRQMAAQMSGLPREAPCVKATDTDQNICPVSTKDVLLRLKNESLIFPPWSVPSYSNLAYALLGRCLVQKYNPRMTYEEYVNKNILQPLELNDTGFNITDSIKSRMAVGYLPDGSVASLPDLGWESPAGQMYSTTADLNKLAHFFYTAAHQNVSEKTMGNILSPDMRRQMELTVFVNRDGKTGFGTPWEIRFQSNYTILRKGGNVDGYSALFSYVPDLQLGLNVLFSGGADEFGTANSAYGILIPPFVSVLSLNQPPYPYPPNPEVFEGQYSFSGTITAKIFTKDKQLFLQTNGQTAYLAYRSEPLKLQIDYPDSLLPCLQGELVASRHEWVVFLPPGASGVSPGFTIPGLLPGVKFIRQS